MLFHLEYLDSDGKHWSRTINMPTRDNESVDASINAANRMAANMARVYGWSIWPGEIVGGNPVRFKMWHPNFPMGERMKRVNRIQKLNGNPELYTQSDIAMAGKGQESILGVQFDSSGVIAPSLLIPPLNSQPIGNSIATTAAQANSNIAEPAPVDVNQPLPATA